MQITSNNLEITLLNNPNSPYNQVDIEKFISKYAKKFDLNCDDLDDSKVDIISQFAEEIVDSNSIHEMKNIVINFSHFIMSRLGIHLRQLDTFHEIVCNKDHDFKYFINADMASIITLKWLDDAHKLVYGNKIPKLDKFIQQFKKVFKKKNENYLYKVVSNFSLCFTPQSGITKIKPMVKN